MKKLTFAAILLGVALLLTSSASAAVEPYNYKIIASAQASGYNDFHVTITCEPGTVIDNIRLVRDPKPDGVSATVTVVGEGTADVEVVLEWIGASLQAGATLEIQFEASVEGLCSVVGWWTIGGVFQADAQLIYVRELPSLTPYGLIGLAVLIALTGLWMYRRKRAATIA